MLSSPSSSSDAALSTPSVAAALLARCTSRVAAGALHARLLRCSRAFFRSPYLANCLGAASSAIALLRAAAKPNVFSHNILLSALHSSGLPEDARGLFDGMSHRDAVTYNAMLSGYVAGALPDEAFRLFCSMGERGVRPTAFTFSILSAAVGSVRRGQQLHAAAVRHGLAHRDAVVGNALIDLYGRVGLLEHAARVFSCMEQPDVTSWNSVMSVYKDQALSSTVFRCFRSMRSEGFSVDGFTVSIVLSVCSDGKDFAKGDQMLALCIKTSVLTNSIVSSAVIDFLCVSDRLSDAVQLFREMPTWASEPCNALISGYARSGLMEEALNLFAVSMRNGIIPNEFSFASVLRWSSCFGLMEQGTQIHCLVCKLGFQNDVIVSTALTDMYCKLGLTKHARKIFSTIGAKDLVLWNTMLLGLLQNGRAKEALVIFKRILKCGIQPDRITLFGALSACGLEGLVTEGMDIITLFKDRYHIMPSLEHYTCVVDMLCCAGMFREAVNYVENNLLKFSAATFANILEACLVLLRSIQDDHARFMGRPMCTRAEVDGPAFLFDPSCTAQEVHRSSSFMEIDLYSSGPDTGPSSPARPLPVDIATAPAATSPVHAIDVDGILDRVATAEPHATQVSVDDFIASFKKPLEQSLLNTPQLRVTKEACRDEDLFWVPRRSARLAANSRNRENKPDAQARKVLMKKLGYEVDTERPDEASFDELHEAAFQVALTGEAGEVMQVLFPGRRQQVLRPANAV